MSYSASRARGVPQAGGGPIASNTANAGRPTSARLPTSSTALRSAAGSKGTTSMLLANLNAELAPRKQGVGAPSTPVAAASAQSLRSSSSADRPHSARLATTSGPASSAIATGGPKTGSQSRPMSSAGSDRTSMAALRREYLGATALMNTLCGGKDNDVGPKAAKGPSIAPSTQARDIENRSTTMAFIQSSIPTHQPTQPQTKEIDDELPRAVLVPSKPTAARPTNSTTASVGPQRRSSLTMPSSSAVTTIREDTMPSKPSIPNSSLATSKPSSLAPTSISLATPSAEKPQQTVTQAVTSVPKPSSSEMKLSNHTSTAAQKVTVSTSTKPAVDTSHLKLGLTSMERRHSGKYVRHFPTIPGHYCCGKCMVPLLSGKHKLPSVGGYATFSEYFQHSVDLEVVVPLASDVFEGSFVALKCVKCGSFFGRLADADVVAMGDGSSEEEDDAPSGDLESKTDAIQVNSCAVVYVAAPPPPGYEGAGNATEVGVPKAQGVLALRRLANNGPSHVHTTKPLSSEDESSDEDDAAADDDLWAAMRTAKGTR